MGEVVRFSDYGRKVSVSDTSDACGADRAPVIILPVVRVERAPVNPGTKAPKAPKGAA